MKNNNWIKAYIIDVLPCISIAFFVLAYVYNAAFFAVFDIDILQYATFGDIFMSITEPLCIFTVCAAIIMAVDYLKYTNDPYFSKENSTSSNNTKKSFSQLSFISKVKNIWFIKLFISFINLYDSLFNMCWSCILSIFYFIIKKLREVLPDTFVCLIVFLLLGGLCEEIYFNLLEICGITPSLSIAAPALVLPLFFFQHMINSLRGILAESSEDKKKIFFSFRDIEKSKATHIALAFAFSYYMCAISVLLEIGLRYGDNIKENNNTSFTIKTSDGTIFDNKSYGYIAHLSEKTFLFNKKNYENVVLYNDNIVYTKVKEAKNGRTTYKRIVSYVNKFNIFARKK